jgi:short-subunit dehydrogenase
LAAFGEALRHEAAPLGVRVLVAYPPGTATAMTRGMAGAAQFPGYRLASAEQVGERIVAALLAGRQEWRGGAGERALALAYRLTPALVRLAFRSQRARFRRMMTAPEGKGEKGTDASLRSE